MAHELMIENGRASMMYAGPCPWHGLGTKLDRPATAEEAMVAANLDWSVRKVPVMADAGSAMRRVPGRWATLREDGGEGAVLGIVGAGYRPLQNRAAFRFFDAIVGAGAAIYHTAGALGRGERVWLLAKLPEHITVAGDDVADRYLLLSNSHDGSSAVQIKFTPVRVVCQNTLSIALDGGAALRVPHTSELPRRLERARVMLGLIHGQYARIERTMQRFARVQLDAERLGDYLAAVFPGPRRPDRDPVRDAKRRRRAETNRQLAAHLFRHGRGNERRNVRGTLWAAYNGVTELIDHRAPPRVTPDRRLQSAWFGTGAATKARAYDLAEARADAWVG